MRPRGSTSGARVSFWWTMGVNQSHQGVQDGAGDHQPGAHDRQHRPARHRGQLDHRPVQRDGLAALLEHHEPARRARLRQPRAPRQGRRACSGSPRSGSPTRPSWAYDQIIEGIEAGKIRGLWVIATNPAHSWIDQGQFRDILGRLDFLVVQDMYHSTETAQLADLLLPAAAGVRRRARSSTPSGGSG